MARTAYPDVPLFRYDYTDLSEAQVQARLSSAASSGPGHKGPLLAEYVKDKDGWAIDRMQFA